MTCWETTLHLAWMYPSSITCLSTARAFEVAGRWRQVVQMLQTMQQQRVSWDISTCSSAASACGASMNAHPNNMAAHVKRRQWRDALGIFKNIELTACRPDMILYTVALNACAKSGRWRRALQFLIEAIAYKALQVNITTFSVTVSGASRSSKWKIAAQLTSDAREENMDLNAVIWGALLDASSKSFAWRRASQLHVEMKPRSLEPSVVAAVSAITAAGSSGAWTLACTLQDSLQPNTVAHNAVLSALDKAGQWQGAIEHLEQREGLQLDVISYSVALEACGKNLFWENALRLWKSMSHTAVSANLIAFTNLAQVAPWSSSIWMLQAAQGLELRGKSWFQGVKVYEINSRLEVFFNTNMFNWLRT
eukprot:symbB.v1.2.001094.t1/scaffold33.1/size517934/46